MNGTIQDMTAILAEHILACALVRIPGHEILEFGSTCTIHSSAKTYTHHPSSDDVLEYNWAMRYIYIFFLYSYSVKILEGNEKNNAPLFGLLQRVQKREWEQDRGRKASNDNNNNTNAPVVAYFGTSMWSREDVMREKRDPAKIKGVFIFFFFLYLVFQLLREGNLTLIP